MFRSSAMFHFHVLEVQGKKKKKNNNQRTNKKADYALIFVSIVITIQGNLLFFQESLQQPLILPPENTTKTNTHIQSKCLAAYTQL